MTTALEEMTQAFGEITAVRSLYRTAQALKRDGSMTQAEVNELADDYEQLVRWFNLNRIRAEVEITKTVLPAVDEDAAIEAIRSRVYDRLEKGTAA